MPSPRSNVPFFNALSEFVRRLYVRRISLLSRVVRGEITEDKMQGLIAVAEAAGCDMSLLMEEAGWTKKGASTWIHESHTKPEEEFDLKKKEKNKEMTERFGKVLGSVGEIV